MNINSSGSFSDGFQLFNHVFDNDTKLQESMVSSDLIKTDGIVQMQESRQVHSYPGDLTPSEKSQMAAHFIDDNTLKIEFGQAEGFQCTIRRQDIFHSKAQVIINAANSHLGGGGGIDGAIHKQGGPEYAEAHQRLCKAYAGNYVLGHAAMIESGALKEKYGIEHVIVVAGPQGETSPQKESELYSCYFNSLVLASQQGVTSLAFPSVSTGIFNFPKKRAVAIILQAMRKFWEGHPNSPLKSVSIHFLETEGIENLQRFSEMLSA